MNFDERINKYDTILKPIKGASTEYDSVLPTRTKLISEMVEQVFTRQSHVSDLLFLREYFTMVTTKLHCVKEVNKELEIPVNVYDLYDSLIARMTYALKIYYRKNEVANGIASFIKTIIDYVFGVKCSVMCITIGEYQYKYIVSLYNAPMTISYDMITSITNIIFNLCTIKAKFNNHIILVTGSVAINGDLEVYSDDVHTEIIDDMLIPKFYETYPNLLAPARNLMNFEYRKYDEKNKQIAMKEEMSEELFNDGISQLVLNNAKMYIQYISSIENTLNPSFTKDKHNATSMDSTVILDDSGIVIMPHYQTTEREMRLNPSDEFPNIVCNEEGNMLSSEAMFKTSGVSTLKSETVEEVKEQQMLTDMSFVRIDGVCGRNLKEYVPLVLDMYEQEEMKKIIGINNYIADTIKDYVKTSLGLTTTVVHNILRSVKGIDMRTVVITETEPNSYSVEFRISGISYRKFMIQFDNELEFSYFERDVH